MEYGILIVSHVPEIAQGLPKLLKQVAKDVSITYAGGTEDNEIGTSINKITEALDENKADKIWAFYDLGSARMNLEMAEEMSDKQITIHDTALIESAYVAASLLQVNTPIDAIEKQLADLKVKGD
ncbi:dihydroxyacetone kinase phosphoryl donor subunit DhaM [Lactobacillus jensenii]|jgi:dihydroxyacetone kinase, phosphotransfer subunit|uniref:phosphoenolpyruvate--glycerone phosphotransferase n=1 Tax=Lactobacillus jensenii TaxID=109790 RepID=A0A5N1I5A8_LACJE|nr:dihydroxyacetone kinase phosphoryl donor subunit DhaM [Lactobacillus jensenii]EEQ69070.1 dihydroxyacetone kinase, phosphotransfer subunit [Lactobacillus jensenii 1153]APT14839.1 PTS mannnose family transporter subunit IIA [Lactobacillus jensenii]EEQ24515.1 dihydroxyacetone kinase, phosphotransfer subunit [Lactobacillus jensenii 269-3]EEX27552.1 dihydroxyacetone kinase, phosphotransfer subunit [Lactobacillus jensenii SJ-7A-US]KAA9234579.1 PTS-dependent dihydroxyacetone kinase phosphotransfer